MAAEGWGEKEICTKGAVDGKKTSRGVGVGDWRVVDVDISFPQNLVTYYRDNIQYLDSYSVNSHQDNTHGLNRHENVCVKIDIIASTEKKGKGKKDS